MHEIVPIVLLIWPVISIVLFRVLMPRDALLVCLIGGWMMLPTAPYPEKVKEDKFPGWIMGVAVHPGFDLHYGPREDTTTTDPDYDPKLHEKGQVYKDDTWDAENVVESGMLVLNKGVSISLGIFLGACIFGRRGPRTRFMPGWWDIPVLLLCVSPLPGALLNELSLLQTIEQLGYMLIVWAVPYLLGRVYLADTAAMLQAAKYLAMAAIIYLPICLLEFLIAPFVYNLVYGFHPFRADGAVRFVLYRPIGFLEHGNQLGMWYASSALVTFWAWRSGAMKSVFGIPGVAAVAILGVATLIFQSIGSVLLLGAAMVLLAVLHYMTPKVKRLALAGLGVCVIGGVLLLGLRVTGVASVEGIANKLGVAGFLKTYADQLGIRSLAWRLKLEDQHMRHVAKSGLVFGLGKTNWWEESKNDAEVNVDGSTDSKFNSTRPWGIWLIIFGAYGVIGLLAWLVVSVLPGVCLVLHRGPPDATQKIVDAMAMLMMINFVDAFMNAVYPVPFFVIAGGLCTWMWQTQQWKSREITATSVQQPVNRNRPSPSRAGDRNAASQGPRPDPMQDRNAWNAEMSVEDQLEAIRKFHKRK